MVSYKKISESPEVIAIKNRIRENYLQAQKDQKLRNQANAKQKRLLLIKENKRLREVDKLKKICDKQQLQLLKAKTQLKAIKVAVRELTKLLR